MSSHTPGPWQAIENGFAFDIDAANESVAFVPSGDDAGRANARLVAAAPTMLAALQAVEALHMDTDGATCDWPEAVAAYRRVVSALAEVKP